MSLTLNDDDRVDWLRLIRSRRVGPGTFARLLGEHETAARAVDALPDIASKAGVRHYTPVTRSLALEEFRRGLAAGYRLICTPDPDYPALLRRTDDAPPVLWTCGQMRHLQSRAIAVVGARNASSLGIRFTRQLVRELGEAGLVVVSGLARGIDAAAHDAALPYGTIAVQAGGLDTIYPGENAELQARIGQDGLRLSEQPLDLIPQARHFPQRNRIIAGLAEATLVVEGATRSGSLLTARNAADQGREVLAVPGNPLDARAGGCNALIREGATLIRSAQDVLEVIGPDRRTAAEPELPLQEPAAAPRPRDVAAQILSLLSGVGVAEDALIRDVGLPPAEVTAHLTALELEGRIARRPGGLLALAG